MTQPLIAPLNGQDTVLGGVEHKALSAMVDSIDDDKVRVVPHLNDTIHSDFVPEMPSAPDGKQRVRYRPLTDSDPRLATTMVPDQSDAPPAATRQKTPNWYLEVGSLDLAVCRRANVCRSSPRQAVSENPWAGPVPVCRPQHSPGVTRGQCPSHILGSGTTLKRPCLATSGQQKLFHKSFRNFRSGKTVRR